MATKKNKQLPDGMIPLGCNIPTEIKEELNEVSKADGLTVTQTVRRLLKEGLEARRTLGSRK